MKKPREICVDIGTFARAPSLCIATFTALAFVGFTCWPVELFAHFRVQYVVLLAIAIPYLLFLERTRINNLYLGAAVGGLIANTVVLVMTSTSLDATQEQTQMRSRSQTPGLTQEAETTLSLLQFNVNSSSTNYPAFDKLIQKLKPDVVCIEEVSEGWRQHFDQIKDIYPYQNVRARPDNFGIAILSKYRIDEASREPIGGIGLPTAFVTLALPSNTSESRQVQVIATHPLPPVSPGATAMRDKHMHELAKRIADSKKLTILAGDFNCTPWSYIFEDFVKESGLRDSRLNKGLQPTWPTMFSHLLIPIDHILSSPQIKCTERNVEGDSGSDHYPVYAKFVL